MPTWSGIIQGLESGKAVERPIVDGGDQVVVQQPVKARYEQHGDTRTMRWDGV